MKVIGSKAEAKDLLMPLFDLYHRKGDDAFITALNATILQQKIRFPVLEYVAKEIYHTIPYKEQLDLTDKIIALQQIGGNVLAGMILQLRLEKDFNGSLKKAVEYIILGDEWYVCDIIGERVMGFALLTNPVKTIPALKKYTKHESKWIVRCVGVATHYAVKKGLSKSNAALMFDILLSCAETTDFHTKKGIGWAAKTVAKFHPDIIKENEKRIQSPEVKQWFKTKVKIGLGRSFKYAAKYNS